MGRPSERAWRWTDGALEAVDWSYDRYRTPIFATPALDLGGPLSKRERRTWARHGVRGRRGSRRIRPVTKLVPSLPMPRAETWVAHRLSDGTREARLYLPIGAEVTAEHCRAVTRAMRQSSDSSSGR